MAQSRILSIIETTLNIGSGILIGWSLAYWVLPLWGYPYSIHEALEITALFAVASWLRSYTWRRLFARRGQ